MEKEVTKNPLSEVRFIINENEHKLSDSDLNSYDQYHCTGRVPKRFIFSLIGFLASTLAISLATNLNIVIVTMVDRSDEITTNVSASSECLSPNISFDLQSTEKSPLMTKQGEFDWDPEIEGFAIGAVYYGQLFGYLPGGRMAEVYGGRKTLMAFLLIASFFTTVTPFAAWFSVYVFIACRFLIGVGTAPVIPVLFYMISRWIPESERSFNASFILAGYGVGAFVSFLTSGILCAADFMGGWPSVFYLGGFSGFVWCLLCYLFIFETPEEHPSISEKELKYISSGLGPIEQKQIKKIPWKSLLTSVPFWSLALGYFGQFWILGFFCTVQTLYMGTILNLDSTTNGELSCLPPLIRALAACICGYPADIALRKGYVGKAFVRKGATIINSIFACLGFVAIMLAGCNSLLNTIFFTIGGLLGDLITFGVCMGCVDIAPNLSDANGDQKGSFQGSRFLPERVFPGSESWVLRDDGFQLLCWPADREEDINATWEGRSNSCTPKIPNSGGGFSFELRSMAQWRYVYYITIGVVLFTTIIYAVFGTSQPQKWGTYDEEPVKENNSKKCDNYKNESQMPDYDNIVQ
ncbi:putative inorganic phosphate cotransporter [Nephila pilipes]|uniref:Putative inorganic phosphate cotransporter n=1 Tax=Nephila pilipes TaxID=299642 RepID=A0A8X6MLH0_NEPPI|nr:putative inorganic phosphate cotransporter [Nephila pilipes]